MGIKRAVYKGNSWLSFPQSLDPPCCRNAETPRHYHEAVACVFTQLSVYLSFLKLYLAD